MLLIVCLLQEGGKFIPELEDHEGHPTSAKVSACAPETVWELPVYLLQGYQHNDTASSPEPSTRSMVSTASGSELYDSASPPDSMRSVA